MQPDLVRILQEDAHETATDTDIEIRLDAVHQGSLRRSDLDSPDKWDIEENLELDHRLQPGTKDAEDNLYVTESFRLSSKMCRVSVPRAVRRTNCLSQPWCRPRLASSCVGTHGCLAALRRASGTNRFYLEDMLMAEKSYTIMQN